MLKFALYTVAGYVRHIVVVTARVEFLKPFDWSRNVSILLDEIVKCKHNGMERKHATADFHVRWASKFYRNRYRNQKCEEKKRIIVRYNGQRWATRSCCGVVSFCCIFVWFICFFTVNFHTFMVLLPGKEINSVLKFEVYSVPLLMQLQFSQ